MTDATILGQLLLFLTTIGGFAIQIYREKRNRQWDLEDRMMARQELAEKVATTHQKVIEKIEENTELSRVAFSEANDVNGKLLEISSQFRSASDRRGAEMRRVAEDNIKGILRTTAATAAKVEKTKAVVDDTHAKVESIEKKLDTND